ncbi:MAG: hypothetical protein ChlgKO_01930 [Chlamydiales bacterium]
MYKLISVVLLLVSTPSFPECERKPEELQTELSLEKELARKINIYLEDQRIFLIAHKEIFKKTKQFEDRSAAYEELKEQLKILQSSFEQFKLNLCNTVKTNFGENRAGEKLYQMAAFEVTEWFINYLDRMLFNLEDHFDPISFCEKEAL